MSDKINPIQTVTNTQPWRPRWRPFVELVVLAVMLSLCMSSAMFLLSNLGFHLVIVSAFFVTILIAVIPFLLIEWSHCRNRWVAATVSLLAALTFWFGFYFYGFANEVGWANAYQIQLIPTYLENRFALDRIDHLSYVRYSRHQPILAGDYAASWTPVVEMAISCLVITGIGWTLAGIAYCEECHRWMKSISYPFGEGCGSKILELFQTDRMDEIAELSPYVHDGRRGSSLMVIHYCPDAYLHPKEAVAYLTVNETESSTAESGCSRDPSTKRLLYQQPLSANQLNQLCQLFPTLHQAHFGYQKASPEVSLN